MSITVAQLGDTEVPCLSQLVAAYGLTVTGETEVPLLQQIATGVCGISTVNLGETEVPLLRQIATYYGVSATALTDTEVPLLQQIILNLPSTIYTQATIADTEVPLLRQWVSCAGSAPVPDAPTGLVATTFDSEQIDLTWDDAPGVTWNVYKSTTTGVYGAALVTGLTDPAYSAVGLSFNTEYFFIVKAVNEAGESAASTEASATTTDGMPVNTVTPSFSANNLNVGGICTGERGTWTEAPTSYEYRWKSDGVEVSGEVSLTLVLTTAMADLPLILEVRAFRVSWSGWVASDPQTPNALSVPVNLTAPTIVDVEGQGTVGDMLEATSNGTWDANPPTLTSETFIWQVDNSGWQDITGEISDTYVPSQPGSYRYQATAENSQGAGTPSGSNSITLVDP